MPKYNYRVLKILKVFIKHLEIQEIKIENLRFFVYFGFVVQYEFLKQHSCSSVELYPKNPFLITLSKTIPIKSPSTVN